jgi:ribosomal protein S6
MRCVIIYVSTNQGDVMLNANELEQVIDHCKKVLTQIPLRDSKTVKEKSWDNFQIEYFTKLKRSAAYYMMGFGVVYYSEKTIAEVYKSVFS